MTPPLTIAGFESPSLESAAAGPAYELKFLVDEGLAASVEAWARDRLCLDPHGDPALGGAYHTTSLYCDTPELDVYHRSAGYRRSKFRVRRYGAAAWVFLERKRKQDDRVVKRRTAVPDADLDRLHGLADLIDWPGRWFQRRLTGRRLGPACRVAYERTACAGSAAEGPLRLTLDRRLRGMPADNWSVAPFEGGLPLLAGQVILELKFRTVLPTSFRELIADLRLTPSAVSKYRLCRAAWGAVSPLLRVVRA